MSETELDNKEQESTTTTTEEEQQPEQQKEGYKEEEKLDLENNPIVVRAKTLELNELFETIKDLDNQYNMYVTGIKAILIRIAAEKLEERGMTAFSNIVDTIADRLTGSKIPVSTVYISKCIPAHLKRVTKASKTKNKLQQQEQEFRSDEDIEKEHINQSSSITPEIANEPIEIPNNTLSQQENQDIEQALQQAQETIKLQQGEIQTLKKLIKEKNLDVSYQEAIQEVKVIKWDKTKVNEIDAAWKNSLREVVFKVDIRTNKLVAAITDKQYKKEQLQHQSANKDTNK